MQKTLTFEYDKSTKGTHRYAEVGTDQVVGTLYVRKSAVGETPSPRIVVTLQFTQ